MRYQMDSDGCCSHGRSYPAVIGTLEHWNIERMYRGPGIAESTRAAAARVRGQYDEEEKKIIPNRADVDAIIQGTG
jgi:hypothetical protein